tara:strand:+ start:13548 stop:14423 length:876 start_codon:yes stop_codon:yes gene_type:complete
MDPRLKKNKLGFYELVDKPSNQVLSNYYKNKYYQQKKGLYDYQYKDSEINYKILRLNIQFEIISNIISKNDKKSLLDIGCGEGFTLNYFFNNGWDVSGIDFSSYGAEIHNPTLVKFISVGDLYDNLEIIENKNLCYDLIFLTNVLEHVQKPVNLMKRINKITKKGGMLVLTVPNDASDLQEYCLEHKMIKDRFWITPPDHLSYFDYKSIKNVAHHTGWECSKIISEFPIDLYLLNPASNYIMKKNNGKKAHFARIHSEIILSKQKITDVIEFYSSMAKVGLGRDLTAFLIK